MSNKPKDRVLDVPSNFREEDELAHLKNSEDVDKLRGVMQKDEKVYRLVICFRGDEEAVLAATNKRIVFVDKRFLKTEVISFSYGEVAAIIYNLQVVTQFITIAHSSRTLTVERVDKDHGRRFVKFVEKAIGGDYTIEGDGHTFRHNDDMLSPDDMPSMR